MILLVSRLSIGCQFFCKKLTLDKLFINFASIKLPFFNENQFMSELCN